MCSGLICVIWIPLIPRPQSGEEEGREREGLPGYRDNKRPLPAESWELGHSGHTERTDENSWLKTIYIFTWPQQCDPLAGQYKSKWNPGTADQETCSWQRYPILTSMYNVHQSIFRMNLFDYHEKCCVHNKFENNEKRSLNQPHWDR